MLLRGLGVISVLSALALAVVAAAGVGPRSSVLLTTGSFVLGYVLGMAAAVRLLPPRSWSRRAAAIALVAVLGLLVMTGVYLLWAAAVALAALAYERHRRRSRPPEPVAPVPAVAAVEAT